MVQFPVLKMQVMLAGCFWNYYCESVKDIIHYWMPQIPNLSYYPKDRITGKPGGCPCEKNNWKNKRNLLINMIHLTPLQNEIKLLQSHSSSYQWQPRNLFPKSESLIIWDLLLWYNHLHCFQLHLLFISASCSNSQSSRKSFSLHCRYEFPK